MDPRQNISLSDILGLFDGMKSAFTFFLGIMFPRTLDGAMFWGLFYLVVQVSMSMPNFKLYVASQFSGYERTASTVDADDECA